MRFGVIVFPGSQCDHDCYHVVKHVLGQPCRYVWHKERSLEGLDCVILPGGFSYGDYLRAGALARFSPIMSEVVKFAERGGLVWGICNGFQILTEAGLLPGVLMRNRSLRFICRYINLRVESTRAPQTRQLAVGDLLEIPIAHMEGAYFIDPDGQKRLEDNDQVVFRYVDAAGRADDAANPNGALANIAGVANERGNVLGMMPHPERCSEAILGHLDGRRLFESLLS